jgi:hypothetical protein
MNLLLNKTNNILLLFIFSLFTQESRAQSTIPSPEIQTRLAVLAAPADKRENATVYGFNATGELVVLRKGSNEMICLADDPSQDGFSVACYHRDLQPFMQRGRELKKSGKTTQEIFDAREQEVKAGKLLMPKDPSTLFVYTASRDNYDAVQGVVKKGYLRYVVYIPYATSESTGLPLKPEGPAMPWIMHPGTHGAHIMINPPKTE